MMLIQKMSDFELVPFNYKSEKIWRVMNLNMSYMTQMRGTTSQANALVKLGTTSLAPRNINEGPAYKIDIK